MQTELENFGNKANTYRDSCFIVVKVSYIIWFTILNDMNTKCLIAYCVQVMNRGDHRYWYSTDSSINDRAIGLIVSKQATVHCLPTIRIVSWIKLTPCVPWQAWNRCCFNSSGTATDIFGVAESISLLVGDALAHCVTGYRLHKIRNFLSFFRENSKFLQLRFFDL